MSRAVKAVRKVTAGKAYVAASVGPCGKLLEPYGDTAPDDVAAGFERQIKTLVAAGVDILCIETMTDLNEAVIAVKAARKVSPTTPLSVTMTFDVTPQGIFTIMGNTVAQCVDALTDAGADILGSNCGNGIDNMTLIAAEFKRTSKLPLIFQANAGLPVAKGDQLLYPETPEFMAEKCRRLLEIGVSVWRLLRHHPGSYRGFAEDDGQTPDTSTTDRRIEHRVPCTQNRQSLSLARVRAVCYIVQHGHSPTTAPKHPVSGA